jgi:hypothetical protein
MANTYITHAGPSSAQASRIQQQQLRAASYGTYNFQPNVAAITMEDVGRRCLVPTRCLAWDITLASGPGVDVIQAIDFALVGAGAFPINVWNNALAADREELYGDTLIGCQVSIQCNVTAFDAAAAGTLTGNLTEYGNALEQMLYQRYSLVINPTSGNRSPIVFDTELRAFSPTHRLSGADGYTAIPATPWGDEFATVQMTTSPNPVVGAYTMFLPNPGVVTDFQIQGVINVSLKKVRGTGN